MKPKYGPQDKIPAGFFTKDELEVFLLEAEAAGYGYIHKGSLPFVSFGTACKVAEANKDLSKQSPQNWYIFKMPPSEWKRIAHANDTYHMKLYMATECVDRSSPTKRKWYEVLRTLSK